MATMVKEKRREKKKSQDKHGSTSKVASGLPSLIENTEDKVSDESALKINENVIGISSNDSLQTPSTSGGEPTPTIPIKLQMENKNLVLQKESKSEKVKGLEDSNFESNLRDHIPNEAEITNSKSQIDLIENNEQNAPDFIEIVNTYTQLNESLGALEITSLNTTLNSDAEISFEKIDSKTIVDEAGVDSLSNNEDNLVIVTPSAPIFEEEPEILYQEPIPRQMVTPKVKPMSIEDATKLYGGQEIAEMKAMSERENAIVEAGPMSAPEHPLVDLLSTFRSSLISMERERAQLAINIAEEENYENKLWKVEKLSKYVSEKCKCGSNVEFRAYYETAHFYKERLPVAKMKLESILRDVQESYCHHLHAALLAHCQIEQLVSETAQSSKSEIRQALALILESLRFSEGVPEALPKALQRWAGELGAALLDARDLRQMIHLIHHLFRQTRSVSWASRIIRHSVNDKVAAAQTIAILELLLIRTRVEFSKECTEASDEWEEIDKHGSSGAVSEGMLRERELVTLVRHMAPRQLVARLLNFNRSDITQTRAAEWLDPSNGSAVFRACCGVRVLIGTLQRATLAHLTYKRLRKELIDIGVSALKGLAALHLHNRDTYSPELQLRLTSELEAAFSEGFNLLKPDHLHRLPASLLNASVARDYCVVLMVGLHDKSPKHLDSLPVEIPVLTCEIKVRMVTQTAADRGYDHELARMVLDFLIQTSIKRKSQSCAGTCDVTARECLLQVIEAHSYLHTVAFQILADLSLGETLDAQSVTSLATLAWRPTPGEVTSVLDHWSHRCPHLIQHLLMNLDYKPHTGLELQSQLSIGRWLCTYSQSTPAQEWAWSVLRRMRVHDALWRGEGGEAEGDAPSTTFEMAFCLLATSWGSCVPLICSQGIKALCAVARVRVREAIHCLAPIMLVMAQSPQSISLTPGFQELFSIILGSGPSLVQRAFGRETVTGADMILKLMLTQLDRNREVGVSKPSLISAWLHALWMPSLPAVGLLDVALLANRMWNQLDEHTNIMLQQDYSKEILNHIVKNSYQAPILCESVCRVWHAQRELRVWSPLLRALHLQRVAAQKSHVDNALKAIGASISSDELIIHKVVSAAMLVPLHHPTHLVLWRLFMHLYLQRPPEHLHESTPPVGPLFFSGLIKSRVMAQIRKRLNDTANYHRTEAESVLSKLEETPPTEPKSMNIETSRRDDNLLPDLTIRDLTGESSDSDDSDSEAEIERVSEETNEHSEDVKSDLKNLYTYHVAAEKMSREYLRWLEEGDKVRAVPYQADIARFIPEHALEEAWNAELLRHQPAIPADHEFPLPESVPSQVPAKIHTPLDHAIRSILDIKDTSSRRARRRQIKSPVEDVDFKDMRSLLSLVEKHLADIEQLSKWWASQLESVGAGCGRRWALVGALRARRPLPAVHKACGNHCRPITIVVPAHEWCKSVSVEQAIEENRACARAGLRRLCGPRPLEARSAAALLTIARRIMYAEAATRVSERAFCSAGSARGPLPAHAHTALFTYLAEKWLCHDGRLVSELLSRWCRHSLTELQQTLCGSLISPRRMAVKDWANVYLCLLKLKLPAHAVFSYISKFEMSRWSESVDSGQRLEILGAILETVQQWGPTPSEEYHVLIELLGVQTSQIMSSAEMLHHIDACNSAAASGALPPQYLRHLCAITSVTADIHQLGHLLRSLGVYWWRARTTHSPAAKLQYTSYAPLIATLLHTLQRSLVRAGLALSYTPERVAVYAWTSLIESWSPWIVPHSSVHPLLSDDTMLQHFLDTWHQLALDAPGTEIYLLQQTFEWTIQTYITVKSGECSKECDSQLSALLSEFSKLPWREHQWFGENSLKIGVQACSVSLPSLHLWLSSCCGAVDAATWRRVADLPPLATALLYFLTVIHQEVETLEEATYVDWRLLPEHALNEALDRFFQQYHNPAVPYHELPQFRLLLSATGMSPPCPVPAPSFPSQSTLCSPPSLSPRASFISRWTRAASDPLLSQHVKGYCSAVLNAIQDIAPYIHAQGELEELFSRAVIIMCLETAAAPALTVWQQWVSKSDLRMVTAIISAASVLTSFEYFAALSDTAARAYLKLKDSTGWDVISSTLSRSTWSGAALVSRGKLTAAYGRALSETIEQHRPIIQAFFNEQLNFVEDELIISTWICWSCRIASVCGTGLEAGLARAAGVRGAARWGGERGLLAKLGGGRTPTHRQRLLCRFALCILSPSEQAIKAYETTCASLLGQNNDAIAWGTSANVKRLARLAIRLYPEAEKYFIEELNLSTE